MNALIDRSPEFQFAAKEVAGESADALLSVRNLSKRYKKVEAVRGIDFDVPRGTCLGLIGPNGAGKSTTIEMLEGLVRPSGGQILYEGRPLGRSYREQVGIVFQTTALQDNLTVRETLAFFGGLYRQSCDRAQLAKRCLLDGFLDRYPRHLSGGERQRLLLAIALVNNPRLIFLDEPTTGLDPHARAKFWELLADIRHDGVTIILSTHYMEEAMALCESVLIMNHGLIVDSGPPRDLLARHSDEAFIELPASVVPSLHAVKIECHVEGPLAIIRSNDVESILVRLQSAGVPLTKLRVRAATLEELYLDVIQQQISP